MIEQFKIYVYGSCQFSERLNNDSAVGNGGYGVVITLNGKQTDQISGGFSYTTNARMDIVGIIEGLKRIKEPSSIVVYLSNRYIIDALTKGWLEKWKANGFQKIKHVDLWKELDKVLQDNCHTISYKHSTDVKFSREFKLAEQLGQKASAKRNLPIDLKTGTNIDNLFSVASEVGNNTLTIENDTPILDSICVDASTIENPGVTEYRGVDTRTRQILFQYKYEEATNNIGEFLAIVHALALYKKQGKKLKIIYSDSANAISWVKQKKCKTKYKKNEKNTQLFADIQRAISWLENNSYETKIIKWNTGAWGEIPADYGRK